MCKYCANSNSALNTPLMDFDEREDDMDRTFVGVNSDGRLVVVGDYVGRSRPICYCPMCGRKLREGAEG
ncbi:TPA: hypothetical protein LTU86_002910 [Listeria monocytogenes]|nr:hypothetical protein [Listeria monocytogenes]